MKTVRTWWGRKFIESLEDFTDPARLARGRGYAGSARIRSPCRRRWRRTTSGASRSDCRNRSNPPSRPPCRRCSSKKATIFPSSGPRTIPSLRPWKRATRRSESAGKHGEQGRSGSALASVARMECNEIRDDSRHGVPVFRLRCIRARLRVTRRCFRSASGGDVPAGRP